MVSGTGTAGHDFVLLPISPPLADGDSEEASLQVRQTSRDTPWPFVNPLVLAAAWPRCLAHALLGTVLPLCIRQPSHSTLRGSRGGFWYETPVRRRQDRQSFQTFADATFTVFQGRKRCVTKPKSRTSYLNVLSSIHSLICLRPG